MPIKKQTFNRSPRTVKFVIRCFEKLKHNDHNYYYTPSFESI